MYLSIAHKFNAKQTAALAKLIEDGTTFPIRDVASALAPLMVELPQVTMHELIESAENEEVSQFEIVTAKVYNLVISFLTTGTIYQHLSIGYKNFQLDQDEIEILDGAFIITSGRHRLTALCTLAELLGTNEQEFLGQLVPVIPSVYTVESIEHANGSRAMTPAEKTAILVQSKGIDSNDFNDVLSSALNGAIPAKALGLAFSLKCEGSELQPTTLSSIGTSFLRQLRNTSLQAKKLFSTYEGIELAYAYAASVLPDVLSKELDKNFARNATGIATTLASLARKNPDIKEACSAIEVIKVVKEKKSKTLSSTRKPKAPKVSEVPQPVSTEVVKPVHPAEISVESEVAPKTRKPRKTSVNLNPVDATPAHPAEISTESEVVSRRQLKRATDNYQEDIVPTF